MKDLIMGTAGHIDHGKTALVKALTGIDCDTHPEEKKRGITINLGFAHLNLQNGNQVGIVDVPGHKDFINTMAAGARGFDFVLLVIAADENIMPQTIEHFNILQSYGIEKCIIALTKIDLVDEQLLKIAENEITQFINTNKIQVFSIVKVSSKTGYGIEELKNKIQLLTELLVSKKTSSIFRLFIDRIFTVKGYGTVVTGSVLGGKIHKDNSVFLLPENKKLKIRKLEKYNKEVNEITAGNRVAINLSGYKKELFHRGSIISDRILPSTLLFDAKIKLFPGNKEIKLWSQNLLLHGTYSSQVKIHLIDRNKLQVNDTAIVQIHLGHPAIMMYGDKFILRNSAGDKTIGFGEVIDAHPLLHKRRPKKLILELELRSNNDKAGFIISELNKNNGFLSYKKITNILDLKPEELREIIDRNSNIISELTDIKDRNKSYLISVSVRKKIENKIISYINTFHKNNPLDDGGRTFNELFHSLKKILRNIEPHILLLTLMQLEDKKLLKKVRDSWALTEHFSTLSENEKNNIKIIADFFLMAGMHTLLENEIIEEANKHKIINDKLYQILKYLCRNGTLYKIDEYFLHKSIVDNSRQELIKFLEFKKNGITVAEFRDLVNGNRKICLLLFKLFDREGITYRDGDYRKLISLKSKTI